VFDIILFRWAWAGWSGWSNCLSKTIPHGLKKYSRVSTTIGYGIIFFGIIFKEYFFPRGRYTIIYVGI
jgi:hypothetical protein